jgi:hypothetical protein
LQLTPSIVLHAIIWAVLVHPGSTNSSGIIGLVSSSLEQVFDRNHKEELDAAKVQVEENDEEDYVKPPKREILSGGSSLAATGLQMSLEQNRGAAVVVELEFDHLIQWFQVPA